MEYSKWFENFLQNCEQRKSNIYKIQSVPNDANLSENTYLTSENRQVDWRKSHKKIRLGGLQMKKNRKAWPSVIFCICLETLYWINKTPLEKFRCELFEKFTKNSVTKWTIMQENLRNGKENETVTFSCV